MCPRVVVVNRGHLASHGTSGNVQRQFWLLHLAGEMLLACHGWRPGMSLNAL